MKLNGYIARFGKNGEGQLLERHLRETAELAARFSADFGAGSLGEIAGYLHDVGKYGGDFQKYIRRVRDFPEEAAKLRGSVDHSSAGAIFCADKFPPGILRAVSFAVAGHHAGLLDSAGQKARLSKKRILEEVEKFVPDFVKRAAEALPCADARLNAENANIFIRLLFSALVDADRLDARSFDGGETAADYDSIETLLERYEFYMSGISAANATEIDRCRTAINAACAKSAGDGGNFFSLGVPTGAGKTLASLGWALKRAKRLGLKRVIAAIPYTSIIAQTARVCRDIFGEKNVLEHHGNAERPRAGDGEESDIAELAFENWDAPVIVTTNVQFFESLYAASASRCRKLHNICRSAVILDEAQMLPPDFLKPVLFALRALADLGSCSVLFCTATPPPFSGEIGSGTAKFLSPIGKISKIEVDDKKLAEVFRRTDIKVLEGKFSGRTLAEKLSSEKSFLCIVNTRRKAAEVARELGDPRVFHLSRSMCPAHIADVLREIGDGMARGENVRAVSTQLVEAGVDLDFPAVFREIAGLDSVVQAAGRCNRNGKLGRLGAVNVFRFEGALPAGFIKKGAQTLEELMGGGVEDLGSTGSLEKYFKLFYSSVNGFDKPCVKRHLWDGAQKGLFEFETAGREFRLIDDDTEDVIVCYGDGEKYLRIFESGVSERWIFRKLRKYAVGVRTGDFRKLRDLGAVADMGGLYKLADLSLYDEKYGLRIGGEPLDDILMV